MKAVILNSGTGTRMGVLTSEHPKCMTEVSPRETILSRQLRIINEAGIEDVVITTGYYDSVLIKYCESLDLPLRISYIKNEFYRETNYIYSIYCARDLLEDDILLMHGDMVFEDEAFDRILESDHSCMAVSGTLELPQKDFKAVIQDSKIKAVGIDFFENALAAQPLYNLKKNDWRQWLERIAEYCEDEDVSKRKVYAENALNEILSGIDLYPLDVGDLLCNEIDNPEDLENVSKRLKKIESRSVYMCFSTDIIHGGHIDIIKKAKKLGRLTVGVMTDQAVATYKRYPLVPLSERKIMFKNIVGISRVVEQNSLSYKDVLNELKPDIVVHGDDWRTGFMKPVRDEVVECLSAYGGKLVEYPYGTSDKYKEIDQRSRKDAAMPDVRRGRLRREIELKGLVTAMEAHDGLTGLVVENTKVYEPAKGARQFDAIWLSSLCDSTVKGKPDIELVDISSRLRTIEDIMEVTTKPIIFDGDTGGRIEHFVYTVRSLERRGVSMIIIEDKTGLKKNSLFGTEVEQTQDSIESFSEKIRAGKRAQKTSEFMICARIESLILEKGMDDALSRAHAFVGAGADAIMIHSRKKEPDEIYEFLNLFRKKNNTTPVVLVPTTYNSVTEEEWKQRGANVIIYANQLIRATVPAINDTAKSILEHHRAQECESALMPFSDIIRLIPEEPGY